MKQNVKCDTQGWRQDFFDRGVTLPMRELKYGFEGTINTKILRKIVFHLPTGNDTEAALRAFAQKHSTVTLVCIESFISCFAKLLFLKVFCFSCHYFYSSMSFDI